MFLQGDSGGKVNIFGDVSTDHCEKNIYTNMRRILNGYRDTVVWIYIHKNNVNGNKEKVILF